MGWINSEKPPEKWSAAFFKMFVERLRQAVNYIDDSNFPDGLSGSVLKDNSMSIDKIYNLNMEIQHTIIALATPYTTTSITLVNVGGYVLWNPVWVTDHITLEFEIVGGIANSSAIATFELHGVDGKIAEITSSSGIIELQRVAIEPPKVGQTLLVKVKTNNATYATNLLSARLIITQN